MTRKATWRRTEVVVQGKKFRAGDVKGGKLYHGSPMKLPVGTVLRPGTANRNFKQSAVDRVSLTSDVRTACYWARKASGDQSPIYLYEVEPLGELEPWRVVPAEHGTSFDLLEARAERARIVRRSKCP